jgi:integrase
MPVFLENGNRIYKDIRKRAGKSFEKALAMAKVWDEECESLLRGETSERKTTLGELLDWYIPHIRDEKHLIGWKTMRGNILPFQNHAGSQKVVSAITRMDIEVYLAKRRQSVRPATVQASLKDLKRMFNVAIQMGWLKDNPAKGIRVEKGPAREPRLPSVEEVGTVLAALKAKHPALYGVTLALIFTGGRLGEVLSLDWQNVDTANGRITLIRRKVSDELTLPLAKPLLEYLGGLWIERGCPVRGSVFLNKDGRPHKRWRVYMTFKRVARRIGLPWLTLKTFRKLAATWALQNTHDIRAAQMLLGHRNYSTTELYLGAFGKAREDAVRALEERLKIPGLTGEVGIKVGNSPSAGNKVELLGRKN